VSRFSAPGTPPGPATPLAQRLAAAAAGLLVAIAANWFAWSLPNRPYDLEATPLGPIRSVSFAPFRAGQSPLTRVYPTAEQIVEDLTLLRGRVEGVRTYTSLEGMDAVPPAARRLGLSVTHSAWIGREHAINQREVAALIAAANAYPDTIKRVIVGNEVLLRQDQKPEALIGYIRQVRQAVTQPVSYADVWEFWQRNPAIAAEVDFITIHILPYWENHPSGVADTRRHVMGAYEEIQRSFPGKPLLIGEAGWPSAGRSRGPAVPSLVNKAIFINAFRQLAAERNVDYNLIEAFDQDWKARLEGTVGANWGLFSIDRTPKWGADGKVVETPAWRTFFLASSVLAATLALWLAVAGRRLRPASLVPAALFVQLAASLGVFGLSYLWTHAYTPLQQAMAAIGIGLVMAYAASLLEGVRRLDDPAADGAAWAWLASRLYLVFVLLAVLMTLLLAFDGRYRDFPIRFFLVPAFATAAWAALRAGRRREGRGGCGFADLFAPGTAPAPSPDHLALIVAGAAMAALGMIIGETLANREALSWAGMLALMVAPFAIDLARTRRAPATVSG